MKQVINPKYKKFVSLLNFSNGKYDIVEVFKDFVTMYAIAIKNKCYYEKIDEQIYFKTIEKYEKCELDIFHKLKDELQNLYMQESKIRDVLGEIYYQIGAIKKRNKQFFSPKEVGTLIALLTKEYLSQKKQEFDGIYDCACGSGVLLLSFGNVLMNKNIDYTKKAFYCGRDIDFICFCMTYIQISLYRYARFSYLGRYNKFANQKNILYTRVFFRKMGRKNAKKYKNNIGENTWKKILKWNIKKLLNY